MAFNKKNNQRLMIDRLLVSFGVVASIGLLVLGGLTWWGSNFVTQNVKNELTSQKIFFPPKGSAGLDPKEFPGLQQYAGLQVDDGIKAKAYANEFIGAHLEKIAAGKTYAQVSAAAKADPSNPALKGQAQALFQGETLRGLLLGDGYAFWTIGIIANYIAMTLLGLGASMVVLTWLGVVHIMMLKSGK